MKSNGLGINVSGVLAKLGLWLIAEALKSGMSYVSQSGALTLGNQSW